MRQVIENIQDRLFSAEDSVCLDRARLVTEAYRQHTDEPTPIRRALAFRHVLTHMTLDLTSNPVFAGNTSSRPRAWMLIPECGMNVADQIAIENDTLVGFLDDKIPDDLAAYWESSPFRVEQGSGGGLAHFSIDFQYLVQHGLAGVIARIDRAQEGGSERQRTYRSAMRLGCEAVIAWAERYASAAEDAARSASDPIVAACHRRVAEACRRVPREPARSLFEGLQAILLLHLATTLEGQGWSISIGLPDRALAQFAPEVAADPDGAADLVGAFLLGVAANSFQGSGSKSQPVTIGGADAHGADQSNAVTRAFLEAFARVPVNDPHLFVRWHPALDDGVWSEALSMLSGGRSMPLLINDHTVAPGLIEAGVAPEDAWDYCVIGCNELGIPGRAVQCGNSSGTGQNDLAVLDNAMRRMAGKARCVDDILAAYEADVEAIGVRGVERRRTHTDKLADDLPFAFCSACFPDCIEAGDDLLRATRYPDIYGFFIRGTTNAVNALAAVEQEIFGQNDGTLVEFFERLDARDPDLLERIASAPKWGTDDDAADALGVALNAARHRALRLAAARFGLPPFAVCHVVRSLHHLDGRRIGHTADGRAAGAPVADSIGADAGTASEGPTAVLNSVLKLNAARWFTGIYNLNLTLPRSQADPALLRCLADAFFADGGQELQIAVLDAAMLREAQKSPERFRDLVVRIAGLNARFVELSALEQQEVIRRAESCESVARR